MRTGAKAPQPVSGVTEFKAPPHVSHWQSLANFNHGWGRCSVPFAECFITSINDDADWAAVDSWGQRLDLRSGETSTGDEIYELSVSPVGRVPCQITRDDNGWHLITRQGAVEIGGDYQVDAHSFSPQGRYALLVGNAEATSVYSCETGEVRFVRRGIEQPRQAVFSAEDAYVLLLYDTRAQVVSARDGSAVASVTDNFAGISEVSAVPNTPGSWTLSGGGKSEIIVYTERGILRRVASLDPGGRLAAMQNAPLQFVDLATGERVPVAADACQFSSKPDAAFVVTFQGAAPMNRIALVDIADPRRLLHAVDRDAPDYGESEIAFREVGEFAYISHYRKEDREDPPFTSTYTHSTEVLDGRSGEVIATLPFVVKSHRITNDRDGTLTVFRGSTETRDDLCAVMSTADRRLVWSADDTAAPIAGVYVNEGGKPRDFLVAYATTPGAVHRISNGRKVADVSGVVTRAEFSDDGHHLVVWYKDGRSELWEVLDDSAYRLAPLGLIVSDVQFLPKTTKLVVRHQDGRAYLLDATWLAHMRNERRPISELVRQLRDEHVGPAGSAWWAAGHPAHHPWQQVEQPTPLPDDDGEASAEGEG